MIRWITDYIGTSAWNNAIDTPDVEILDVRDLVDGAGNSSKLVADKINLGIELIQKRKKLIVCCEYGMSRSNAIAVGIISKIEKCTFNQSLKLVINSTKENQIKLSVLSTIKEIIDGENVVKKETRGITLIVDYDDYIGRELSKKLQPSKWVLLKKSEDFNAILSNPAQIYLLAEENNIDHIIFVSGSGIVNTNEFVGKLVFFLKNILDVCMEANYDFFFMSSLDVFLGFKKDTLTIESSSKKKPDGNKGLAYSIAEDLIAIYQKKSGLKAAIIRVPVVYGNHGTKPYFITGFIKKAQTGADIKIHRYKNNLAWVNLIHIDDLTEFLSLVLKKGSFGNYNIDGGEELNTLDISRNIIKIYSSESKVELIDLDKNLVKISIRLDKLKQKLGWRPRKNFYITIKEQKHGQLSN